MAASANPDKKQILIASRDADISGHYTGILYQQHHVRQVDSLAAMHDGITSCPPDLLFIDPLLGAERTTLFLTTLIRQLQGLFTVIIDNQDDRQVDQHSLFKAGARGFCRDDITPPLLTRAVNLMLEGEYWIPRKLITCMISELASEDSPSPGRGNYDNALVNTLTPRELQVARMVHLGGNNKMIARELDISERTVKAHLSAIFRKLEIENRLNLALFFSEIS
jgi:DNA-binding NarL/FixJ family response regulator